MLMNTLIVLVNEIFLEIIYKKRKNKLICFTAFYKFYKNCIKIFLKSPLTNVLKTGIT